MIDPVRYIKTTCKVCGQPADHTHPSNSDKGPGR